MREKVSWADVVIHIIVVRDRAFGGYRRGQGGHVGQGGALVLLAVAALLGHGRDLGVRGGNIPGGLSAVRRRLHAASRQRTATQGAGQERAQ